MNEILYSENLQSMSNIRHGFFTSQWGDCGFASAGGEQNMSNANRNAVAAHLSVKPENLLSCYQIHSPKVVTVDRPWAVGERPQADAMVTNKAGLALGILTADCVPALFIDRGQGVIGAAHAGWRGAVGGIIENTLEAMEKLGASRKYIHAALGPCIWQRSYEVGTEFPAPFLAEDEGNRRFFRPSVREGHFMFDLPGYLEAKLRKLGIASVDASPADTAADEARFFSYRRSTLRREQRGGSLISVIVLAA